MPTAGCVVSGRLVRCGWTRRPTAVGNPTVLIDGWCQQFSSHSIGDLRFGPDGMLYVSAGEGASFNYADYGQTGNIRAATRPTRAAPCARRTSGPRVIPLGYSGAVIRVNPDGGTPAIVAYGFRNPFRFAVRPGTNELWVGDVGWSAWEELDRIAAPDPLPRSTSAGRATRAPGARAEYDALNKPLCETLYALGDTAWAKPYWTYSQPRRSTSVPRRQRVVSGVAFASTGGDYPAAYQGGLFVSDYSRDCIWYLPRGANGLPDAARVSTFAQGGVHRSSSSPAPDGNLLYADINDGSIVRITYQRPVAVASAAPTSGAAPLTVQLDGTASTGASSRTPGISTATAVRRRHGRAPVGHLRGRDVQRCACR